MMAICWVFMPGSRDGQSMPFLKPTCMHGILCAHFHAVPACQASALIGDHFGHWLSCPAVRTCQVVRLTLLHFYSPVSGEDNSGLPGISWPITSISPVQHSSEWVTMGIAIRKYLERCHCLLPALHFWSSEMCLNWLPWNYSLLVYQAVICTL